MNDTRERLAGNVAGTSVLVVEDDDTIRDLVIQVLTEEGYRVVGAPDGTTALDLAARTCTGFGTVLLDLSLPDMDSRDFVARYTGLPAPPAPLVVFTAAHPTDAATAADQIGAAGFVTKPFELDALLEIVSRCQSAGPLPARPPLPSLAPRSTPSPTDGAPPPPNGAPPPPARPRLPSMWEVDARRRQLTQLRDEVAQVQATLTQARSTLQELAAVEATRRLTADEARRVAAVRRESEALRLELQRFHQEFTHLREAGRLPVLA